MSKTLSMTATITTERAMTLGKQALVSKKPEPAPVKGKETDKK